MLKFDDIASYIIAFSLVYAFFSFFKRRTIAVTQNSGSNDKNSVSCQNPLNEMLDKSQYLFETYLHPAKQTTLDLSDQSEFAVIVVRATESEGKMFFSSLDKDKIIRWDELDGFLLDVDFSLRSQQLKQGLSINDLREKLENQKLIPVLLHFPTRDSDRFEVINRNVKIHLLSDMTLTEFMLEFYRLELISDNGLKLSANS